VSPFPFSFLVDDFLIGCTYFLVGSGTSFISTFTFFAHLSSLRYFSAY
jgi:hypothetical protein